MIARVVAFLAVIAALFGVIHYIDSRGYARAKAEDVAAINAQKAEAASKLSAEKDKTSAAEKALAAITHAQELKDHDHEQTIAAMSDRLRSITGPSGRLRDPHATGCRSGGGGATSPAITTSSDRAENLAEDSGLLSADLSGLLQRLTREADDINAAYASCRADAFAVRQMLDAEYRLPGM
jgi:uncharacterized membrane protein YdfJ with MMPL/SSD domain